MTATGPTGGPAARNASLFFLEIADTIADGLVRQAVWNGNNCTWLGYDVDEIAGAWQPVYGTIDDSLYGGLPGVALFLADMWSRTRKPDHARAAGGAAREAMRLLRERRSVSRHGWYNGLSGTLWAVRQVARTLPELSLPDEDLVDELMGADPPEDGAFDLISGASGTISGLLAISDRSKRSKALATCQRLADRLLDSAGEGPGIGLSWSEQATTQHGSYPPCGLAHGASSVAAALLDLWSVCGDGRYRDAAFAAFRYERQWFDRRRNGWPDLREVTPPTAGDPSSMTYPAYWCYGAGGIALSRLRAWSLTADRTVLAEANAALFACKLRARTVLARSSDGADLEENASLCHGLGSILEPLLYSARLGHDPQALSSARDLAMAIGGSAQEEWRCGVVGGGETPGLMLGLAGIGSLFLALHDPGHFRPVGLPPFPTAERP